MFKSLYPYQEKYLQDIPAKAIFNAGLGSGKTAMSLVHYIRKAYPEPLLVVGPAAKMRTGDWEQELADVFRACELEPPEVIYISYEKIRLMDKTTRLPRWWQYTARRNGGKRYAIIAEECLTGETLVTTNKGLKEIADIKVGNKVLSYNHKTGETEYKPVIKLIKRKSDELFYKVNYLNGAIISTYNHPHFVNGEYKLAKDIKLGDYLYEQRKVNDTSSSAQTSSNQNANEIEKVRQESDVQLLQEGGVGTRYGRKTSATPVSKNCKILVLLKRLRQSFKSYGDTSTGQNNGGNTQQPRISSQSKSNTQEEWNGQAYMGERRNEKTPQGGQRENNRTPTNTIRQLACGVGTGITHKNTRTCRLGLPIKLQGRYRQSITNDSDRNRRSISQLENEKVQGRKENQEIKPVRVESVEILKQTDIERLGTVRNPNYVYCLEVEDNNNFFANGILTHNCHALKNPQNKQSKALYEMTRDVGFFIGLSGTLISNGWIDFAGYSKLFGYTKGITEFKRKYCRIQDYKGFPEIVGYYNTDELDRQLKAIAYPLTREQALELPDKQFIGKAIQLPSKDQKRYTELRLTRENKTTGELLDNPSRLLSVLRQSTIDARLDNLLSIVNDTDDNIIIFYNYVAERKAILKLLRKTEKQILRYDGEQHDKLPASDSNIKNTVLLAHYKSGSTGLNLQWANVTIYFSLTYSYQEYEQSKGRTWRTGQTKKCLYYIFKVQNTVDEQIIDCLKKKQDFSEKLWIKKNT